MSDSFTVTPFYIVFGGAARAQRSSRSIDLTRFSPTRLDENRQQDDPATARDPIGNPHRPTGKMEPEFAQLAVQLSGIGVIKLRSFLGKQIDVEGSRHELRGGQPFEPVSDFWLQFHGIPCHSVDAMAQV